VKCNNSSSCSVCSVATSILVLLAILGAVYAVFAVLIGAFADLDPLIGAALAATAGTVVVCVALVILSRWHEARAAAQKELDEKRAAVYEQLLQFMFRNFMSVKTGETIPEADALRFMANFAQRMMVWGSDEVLAAWCRFRAVLAANATTSQPARVMPAYEDLILTIRRDLGHDNRDLEPGKLASLFLEEIPKPPAR
jgi:hypothetical protein